VRGRPETSSYTGVLAAARLPSARLAWLLCAFALLLAAVALVLAVLGRAHLLPPLFYPQWDPHLIHITGSLAPLLLGGLIASRRPRTVYGWLWIAFGLALAVLHLVQSLIAYAVATGTPPPALGLLLLAGGAGWLATYAVLPSFLMLLFPSGRLPSPGWRRLLWVIGAAGLASLLVSAFLPGESGIVSVDNPFGVTGTLGQALQTVDLIAILVLFLCALLSALSLVWRSRHASGVERQQIKWFAYAAVLFGGGMLVISGFLGQDLPGIWDAIFETAMLNALYVALGIAILRYRLFDIDVLINRTLVYGALTAAIVGLYVVTVGGLGTLLKVEGNLLISLLGAGLIAVLFAPLRDRLQRGVNRLMYGERDDPYTVLARLGERLESTLTVDAALPVIVETIAGALRLPYTAIMIKQADGSMKTVAQHGTPPPASIMLPLSYQQEVVGQLVLAPRSPGESFTAADRRLLDDLARQVGVVVHAVRLTTALQHSRERLVMAREEERRRLRRDLHDGVGPQLAALTLRLEAARNRLDGNAEMSDLLRDLAEQVRVIVGDIRRSVYGLRPPSLDELGLVAAVEEVAAQYGQSGLGVTVEAETDLPAFPAAVEVAIFRIVQEALTNVARHANARHCTVRLSLDGNADTVRLEVEDDGRGIGRGPSTGVGLASMRERAEELGGRFAVGASESGTIVTVILPYRTLVGNPAEEAQ